MLLMILIVKKLLECFMKKKYNKVSQRRIMDRKTN